MRFDRLNFSAVFILKTIEGKNENITPKINTNRN